MDKRTKMSANVFASIAQDENDGKVKEPGSGIKHGGRSVYETGAEDAVEIEAVVAIGDVVPVGATTFQTEIALTGTPDAEVGARSGLEEVESDEPPKKKRKGNEGKKGGEVGNSLIPPDSGLSSGSTECVERPQAVRTIPKSPTFTMSSIESIVGDAEKAMRVRNLERKEAMDLLTATRTLMADRAKKISQTKMAKARALQDAKDESRRRRLMS